MANRVLEIVCRFKIKLTSMYPFQESGMGLSTLLIWADVFAKFAKLRYVWSHQLIHCSFYYNIYNAVDILLVSTGVM